MNKKFIIGLAVILAFSVTCTVATFVIKNFDKQNDVKVEVVQDETKTPSEILDEVNKYQARYFGIIKRHNALLDMAGEDEAKQDLKELADLYKEVESKINPNNQYFIEYKNIQNKFKENKGNTTFEMNEFAQENYRAVDKLLNNVYSAVKAKLQENDFNNLKTTQKAWLKEVTAYDKVYEAQGFGSIGYLVKSGYEIDMRNFRTLLLMMFLSDQNKEQTVTNNNTYKSIIPVEKSKLKGMSSTGALKIMIQQDKDMQECVNNSKDVNGIFETFYNNLSQLVNVIKVNDLNISHNKETNNYSLNPDTKLINFQVNNWSGIWLNNSYLEEKYSKYLNNEWKEYLKLSAQNDDLRLSFLIAETEKPIELIKNCQLFLHNYPNFTLNKKVISYIGTQIINLLHPKYDIKPSELKIRCEKLLKVLNKNTGGYIVVKNLSNYIEDANYTDLCDKYSENFLKIDESVKEYAKLSYDKEDFAKIYKEAENYSKKHLGDKDENGNLINAGTSSYEWLIKEYFENTGGKYLQIYNTIWNYCEITTESEVEFRNCHFEEFEK